MSRAGNECERRSEAVDHKDSKQIHNDLDREVKVRYVDSCGTYHEDRLHLLNLAAFILNHVKQPG